MTRSAPDEHGVRTGPAPDRDRIETGSAPDRDRASTGRARTYDRSRTGPALDADRVGVTSRESRCCPAAGTTARGAAVSPERQDVDTDGTWWAVVGGRRRGGTPPGQWRSGMQAVGGAWRNAGQGRGVAGGEPATARGGGTHSNTGAWRCTAGQPGPDGIRDSQRRLRLAPDPAGSGGGSSTRRVRGLHPSVGQREREFPVRAEFDDPPVVVDLRVVDRTHGEQVVEVGASAVAPPDDVVQLAAVVRRRATGDRTASIQRPQRPALVAIREAGGSAEVQFARCVQHHAVANHDADHLGLRRRVERARAAASRPGWRTRSPDPALPVRRRR